MVNFEFIIYNRNEARIIQPSKLKIQNSKLKIEKKISLWTIKI